jgi:hypothetical protein
MNSQLEFDCVKDLPKAPRLGKVHIDLGYYVDLNDESMVQHAKDCLYEDLCSLVKYNELYDALDIVEAPEASIQNIPEFLTESID